MANRDAEFARLMQRVLDGSEEATQQLHTAYGPHILRAVRQRLHRRLRSKFDSLDFVQDVWASFFSELPERKTFATPQDLVAFLTVIARNKVVDVVRMRMQQQKYNINRETPLESLPSADRFPAAQQTPSEIMMGKEEWEVYLQKQPLVHRRILLLWREGETSSRIAEELRVSQRTVSRVLGKVISGDS